MAESSPNVVVLAGPNGAGKSSSAESILQDGLGIDEFVNADVIARGLSGFKPERAAVAAGRIMLARLRELASQRQSFAFETTLASRTFAPWLADLIRTDYQFHLIFLWLPSADMAVARVASRVREGGHDVPEATIRRRYEAGLRNFSELYQPMARTWRLCDNSGAPQTRLIAAGEGDLETDLIEQALYKATVQVMIHHKRLGNPVVAWQDGRVVWIPPQEIEIPEMPEPHA
jgi:predicted ABC-type ATPase